MAYAPGEQDPPAFRVGVDIMKVELSKRETFTEFVKIFSEQVRFPPPTLLHTVLIIYPANSPRNPLGLVRP